MKLTKEQKLEFKILGAIAVGIMIIGFLLHANIDLSSEKINFIPAIKINSSTWITKTIYPNEWVKRDSNGVGLQVSYNNFEPNYSFVPQYNSTKSCKPAGSEYVIQVETFSPGQTTSDKYFIEAKNAFNFTPIAHISKNSSFTITVTVKKPIVCYYKAKPVCLNYCPSMDKSIAIIRNSNGKAYISFGPGWKSDNDINITAPANPDSIPDATISPYTKDRLFKLFDENKWNPIKCNKTEVKK